MMDSGCWTAVVFLVVFVGAFALLIWFLVKAGKAQRRRFVEYARTLGANAEVDPEKGASVRVVSEGRQVRIFLSESFGGSGSGRTQVLFGNLELMLSNTALEMDLHGARAFEKSMNPLGRPDFDEKFHLSISDPSVAQWMFTDEVCTFLLQSWEPHDIRSYWKISQGRLHASIWGRVEDEAFRLRFQAALRAAVRMAGRLDH